MHTYNNAVLEEDNTLCWGVLSSFALQPTVSCLAAHTGTAVDTVGVQKLGHA